MTRSHGSSPTNDHQGSDNSSPLGLDVTFNVFSNGVGSGTPNVSALADATASLGINLQGLVAPAATSIQTNIRDVINLNAWGQGPLSATSTASASEQGTVVVINKSVTGNARTGITEDVTAYLPTSHVSIHLHVTDVFNLSLSGQGYTGATLTEATTSTSVIKLSTSSVPTGAPPATFDLAKFAAVVLGTTTWDINFGPSVAGQSLQVQGHSLRTVDAEADILSSGPGSAILHRLTFHDADQTNFNFSGHTPAITTGHVGPTNIAPIAINAFFNGLHFG